MKYLLPIVLCMAPCLWAQQTEDQKLIRNLYTSSLTNSRSYHWLDHLSNQIGGRLSGSDNAERAVQYTAAELRSAGADTVWLQPVMVPKWVRGAKEYAHVETTSGKTIPLNICALGGSVATPKRGISARVVEVSSFADLELLGPEKIRGRIVFYNRPMEDSLINTFEAYSGCVDQRYSGAMEAARFGAAGVIVRSMNLREDEFPHTGSMTYGDLPEQDRIPSAAISTRDANLLSALLREDPASELLFIQACQNFPEVASHNVIAELKGSENPDQIITIGGHLDSWDLGDGAHDDGAGCVQSMEVLRLFRVLGIRPKNTIRIVLFMNEENGLRGGNAYAAESKARGEKHLFALESDAGGFSPRGFSFDCTPETFETILKWKPYFEPYLVHLFTRGGSGADIGPLKDTGAVLAGLRPDSQRYFDHHHSVTDTFEHVNKRELELGAATMAALVYLVDKYGFDQQPDMEK